MALRPITADSWAEEIADAAREFFNATIDVLLPGTPGKYNPSSDSYTGGTEDTPVIEDRPARAQHIRLATEQSGSREWSAKRRYRFQIDLLPGDPTVTKGMIVRVRDGGRDPSLVDFAFEVITASNSSHAALRTIETVTEGGVAPSA